jgi:hypothetical protein
MPRLVSLATEDRIKGFAGVMKRAALQGCVAACACLSLCWSPNAQA